MDKNVPLNRDCHLLLQQQPGLCLPGLQWHRGIKTCEDEEVWTVDHDIQNMEAVSTSGSLTCQTFEKARQRSQAFRGLSEQVPACSCSDKLETQLEGPVPPLFLPLKPSGLPIKSLRVDHGGSSLFRSGSSTKKLYPWLGHISK